MNESALLYPRYRIETSGWDQSNEFFVEECTMDWSESSVKKVTLRHQIEEGTALFVRLISPSAGGESFPVVYRAKSVGPAQADGRREVEIEETRPMRARAAEEMLVTVSETDS